MDNNYELVKKRIIANSIIDWCSNKSKIGLINFNNKNVSSYIKFRFTTPIIDKVISPRKNNLGYWGNGLFILYEIFNEEGNISVSLLASSIQLNDKDKLNKFLNSNMVDNKEEIITIKSWSIFTQSNKLDNLNDALEHFFYDELQEYEKEVIKWIKNNDYIIFDLNYELAEGAIKEICSNKYERNKEARELCIKYHGSKCSICGFDFGKVYGKEFEGKIEVHHIIPLSEIKEEYIVDPINDLIPVCPNCHMILHSKHKGVYTPEEVKNIINNKNK